MQRVPVSSVPGGAQADSSAAKNRGGVRFRRSAAYKWLYGLIIGAAFLTLLRIFFLEITPVSGPSMENTLFSNERILVDRISYHFRKPKRGEIVICRYPSDRNVYVKRIVALEGERVAVVSGAIWIDGEPLDESAYWRGSISQSMEERLVPEGHVFVVGDNRNRSVDSRESAIGAIPLTRVNGKAIALLWPFDRFRFF